MSRQRHTWATLEMTIFSVDVILSTFFILCIFSLIVMIYNSVYTVSGMAFSYLGTIIIEGGEVLANVVMNVEGMSCNHCKMSVEKALKTLNGVKDAVVNLAGKTVSIDYDPAVVDGNNLKKTISDAGYEVK